MRGLLVLLLALSLAAAMVPRARNPRAVYTEEEPVAVSQEPVPVSEETSTVKSTPVYCQEQTPCEWRLFHSTTRLVEETITNTYCECLPNHSCQFVEEDTGVAAQVFRCRPPPPAETDASTTETANSEIS